MGTRQENEKTIRESEYAVKGVKTFMGMDTQGYNCNLYRKGKKIASVIQDGSGGGTFLDFTSKTEEKEFSTFSQQFKEPWGFKRLPHMEEEMTYNEDITVDVLVTDWELKRRCKKHVCFTMTDKKGEVGEFEYRNTKYSENFKVQMHNKYGKDLIEIINERYV